MNSEALYLINLNTLEITSITNEDIKEIIANNYMQYCVIVSEINKQKIFNLIQEHNKIEYQMDTMVE